MRDPEDLRLYEFAGKLKSRRQSTYLRVELLQMCLVGEADLESAVRRCDDGYTARIFENPALLGQAERALFKRALSSIVALRARYRERGISSREYFAARDAALQTLGTSTYGLCRQRLDEMLPSDTTGSLSVERRTAIFAEVLRDELAREARQVAKRGEAQRLESEELYRRASVRGSRTGEMNPPKRAYVAAVLCGLGLLVDAGTPLRAVGPSGPTEEQVLQVITISVISALIRGPFIASVLLKSKGWRSRASFTIACLAVLTLVSSAVLAAQALQLRGGGTAFALTVVVGACLLRLGWLIFWVWYLGLLKPESTQK